MLLHVNDNIDSTLKVHTFSYYSTAPLPQNEQSHINLYVLLPGHTELTNFVLESDFLSDKFDLHSNMQKDPRLRKDLQFEWVTKPFCVQYRTE